MQKSFIPQDHDQRNKRISKLFISVFFEIVVVRPQGDQMILEKIAQFFEK
jgi:hypothetical protein